ncbi:MAG: complex I subunit 5 family protein [Eubacteriales bacterium]|nr:complex I subunit 5 family protein [Eubacteriales bacterium]
MQYGLWGPVPSFSDGQFQLLYGLIATIMWICALLFSKEYMHRRLHGRRYYVFMGITYLATMGVFLSADLLTLFVFFEIMSFSSYVLVVQEETPEALEAAGLYLAVSVAGGMALLMGLFLLQDTLGTLEWSRWAEAAASLPDKSRLYVAGGFAAVGFGAKAGLFPLHIWLPKAHPVAPAPASALLSGILTKAGVFGLIILSVFLFEGDNAWGTVLLILGLITMLLGAVLALFSVDLKRTLACSSVSQIGFITLGLAMVCILGTHNAIAARGVILHMVNHSSIKLLLFLCAGVIYLKTHHLGLNEIRGFGRKKPLLGLFFLTGAASIAGLPLTSGYVSKTLLHEAIAEHLAAGIFPEGAEVLFSAAEWIFLLTGGLTVAYMAKLFVCIFLEKNADQERQAVYEQADSQFARPASLLALIVPAIFLAAAGVAPYRILNVLADGVQSFVSLHPLEHSLHYYTAVNLSGALISIGMGSVIYGLIVRKFLMKSNAAGQKMYADRWPPALDLERLVFRPLVRGITWVGVVFIGIVFARSVDLLIASMENDLFRQIHSDEERFSPLEWMRNHPMADFWRRTQETYAAFSQSLSFGLLATVIGLCAVLIYLL